MQASRQAFVDELVMFIRNQFADLNMENYPPPNTALKTTSVIVHRHHPLVCGFL